MRGILIRLLLTALVRRRLLRPCPRRRRTRTPCAQQTDPATGECLIWIEVPGTPGTPGEPGDDGPQDTGSGAACYWDGTSQGITKPPPGPVPCSSPVRATGRTATTATSVRSSPSRRRATRAGRATSPATARSTTATSRRPVCSSPSGRRTRRRTPARDRRRARWRRSRSSRCICRPSTSASRPSRVRTASAWSACRSGCGPRTRTPTPSARSPRAPRPAASRSPRPRRSSHITWDMGDGTEVVCNTAGTPYKPEFGRKDSPDCGHTYKKSSARPDG